MKFDEKRALLRGPNMFKPFRVPVEGEPVGRAGLDPNTQLIVFNRGGRTNALLLSQMAYHHVAQGESAGEPYLVTF